MRYMGFIREKRGHRSILVGLVILRKAQDMSQDTYSPKAI